MIKIEEGRKRIKNNTKIPLFVLIIEKLLDGSERRSCQGVDQNYLDSKNGALDELLVFTQLATAYSSCSGGAKVRTRTTSVITNLGFLIF